MLQVGRNVSFGGGGKAPLNKEEVKLFLLHFALVDEKLLSILRLALRGILNGRLRMKSGGGSRS